MGSVRRRRSGRQPSVDGRSQAGLGTNMPRDLAPLGEDLQGLADAPLREGRHGFTSPAVALTHDRGQARGLGDPGQDIEGGSGCDRLELAAVAHEDDLSPPGLDELQKIMHCA